MKKFRVQIATLCLLIFTLMSTTVFAAGDVKSIEGVSRLKNLETISLVNQSITSIPDELGNLPKLKHLNLSGNQLTAISSGVTRAEELETLDLSNNQLSVIPDDIDMLVNLKTLSIANNTEVKHLPDSMENMTALESIDVTNTGIKCLPLAMEPIAITDKKPNGITYGLTVTYDSGGGSAVDSIRLDQDQKVGSIPSDPVKDGFVFEGWFTDTNYTDKWDFATDVVGDHMSLFAKWSGKPASIIFEENSGSTAGDLTGVTDQAISDRNMPTITRAGYSFGGWYTASDFSGSATIQLPEKYPVSGITYYAKWTANASAITFAENGGLELSDLSGVTDEVILYTDMPTITRSGYTFGGWYAASDFTGVAVTKLPDKYPINGIEYYAKWNADPSTIVFDENNGSNTPDLLGYTDQFIINRNMPTIIRSGYTFGGWYTASDFSGAAVTQLPEKYPVSGITYHAKWTADASNIIFEENGGTPATDLTGVTDQVISNQNMPSITRSGYSFGGWYAASDFSGAAVTQLPAAYPVSGITYHAKWTADASNIIFEENSGTTATDLTGVTDQVIADRNMPTITRSGYTFGGWYVASDFSGAAVTQLPEKYPVSGITYHAKWTADASTITFEENSGSTATDLTGVTDQVIADRNMPTITRSGYTFGGWYVASDFSGAAVTQLPEKYPVSGITYHAKWTADASNIIFEENSGSPATDLTGVTDQVIADRNMPSITRSGYTFSGWYVASDFSGAAVTQLPATYPVSGITYYAKWTSEASTITFEENSGSPATDLTGATDQAIADRNMPTITRSGYTFTGWFTASDFSGAAVTQLPEKYPVSGITYHAKWTADASTIIFEENSGSPATDLTGVTDQVIADRNMPSITRSGYTFSGWYTASDFSGIAVTQLPAAYPVTGITYHAKWTADASTIAFIENGGSSAFDLGGVTDQTISNRTMPTITRSGYTFSGWYAASDFSGAVVTQLPTTYPVTGITYYAKWTANASTIAFEENSGSAVTDLTGVTDQVISNRTLPSISRVGYTLDGWYAASDFSGAVVTQLPAAYPVTGITYYAKWTINTYTITFNSNGGTAVGLKTATYNTAITTPTQPTKTNAFFGAWYTDVGLTDTWDFANDKVTSNMTLFAKWTDIPPAGSPLSAYTWPEIQLISEAGKGDEYFNVGDTKDLVLSPSGEVLTMSIYDFAHDNKADNTGKAGITFGTKHLMANTRAINPGNNTNYYGWEGSDIRGWMNGISTQYAGTAYTTGTTSLYSQLPAEVQSAIKPVKKLTSGGYNNNVLVTSTDKLFAFSEVESHGTTYYSLAGEGAKYAIFTDNASRVKKMSNGSGGVNYYWGRSPYSGGNGYFTLVYTDGSYSINGAASTCGVAFGFCI